MKARPVCNLPFDDGNTATNGPLAIDRRSAASALTELSAGFVEFSETGATDPWTLPYEEALYVIEGRMTLTYDDEQVVCEPGDLITLERGTTVVYSGTVGTRVLFSLVPANWRESGQG